MYLLIIQWSVISLILIVLVHYLYSFFQTTLTIPKIKDLVNRPASAYKEMYETINNDNLSTKMNTTNSVNSINSINSVNSINSGSSNQKQTMKDELKSYLTNLSTATPTSMNNVSSFEYANVYSSY
jgi:hypothetical protein